MPQVARRGATVHIVGEAKSPDALRNASDQFFEWVKPAPESELTAAESVALKQPSKAELVKPAPSCALSSLWKQSRSWQQTPPEGKVSVEVGFLPQALLDPSFSPKSYGHSGTARHAQDLRLVEGPAKNRRALDCPTNGEANGVKATRTMKIENGVSIFAENRSSSNVDISSAQGVGLNEIPAGPTSSPSAS